MKKWTQQTLTLFCSQHLSVVLRNHWFVNSPEEPPAPPVETPWDETESDVVHLSDESFKSTLKKKKHALVMFYAPCAWRHVFVICSLRFCNDFLSIFSIFYFFPVQGAAIARTPSLISCVLLNNLLKTQKYSSHMTEPVKSLTLWCFILFCRFCLLLLTVLDTKRRVLRTKCKATQHSCISTTARMRRNTRVVERQDRLTIRVVYNNNGR